MEPACSLIRKDMTILQVLTRYPRLKAVFHNYKMACCGCFAADCDTVEQVALAHGLDPADVLRDLNVAALLYSTE